MAAGLSESDPFAAHSLYHATSEADRLNTLRKTKLGLLAREHFAGGHTSEAVTVRNLLVHWLISFTDYKNKQLMETGKASEFAGQAITAASIDPVTGQAQLPSSSSTMPPAPQQLPSMRNQQLDANYNPNNMMPGMMMPSGAAEGAGGPMYTPAGAPQPVVGGIGIVQPGGASTSTPADGGAKQQEEGVAKKNIGYNRKSKMIYDFAWDFAKSMHYSVSAKRFVPLCNRVREICDKLILSLCEPDGSIKKEIRESFRTKQEREKRNDGGINKGVFGQETFEEEEGVPGEDGKTPEEMDVCYNLRRDLHRLRASLGNDATGKVADYVMAPHFDDEGNPVFGVDGRQAQKPVPIFRDTEAVKSLFKTPSTIVKALLVAGLGPNFLVGQSKVEESGSSGINDITDMLQKHKFHPSRALKITIKSLEGVDLFRLNRQPEKKAMFESAVRAAVAEIGCCSKEDVNVTFVPPGKPMKEGAKEGPTGSLFLEFSQRTSELTPSVIKQLTEDSYSRGDPQDNGLSKAQLAANECWGKALQEIIFHATITQEGNSVPQEAQGLTLTQIPQHSIYKKLGQNMVELQQKLDSAKVPLKHSPAKLRDFVGQEFLRTRLQLVVGTQPNERVVLTDEAKADIARRVHDYRMGVYRQHGKDPGPNAVENILLTSDDWVALGLSIPREANTEPVLGLGAMFPPLSDCCLKVDDERLPSLPPTSASPMNYHGDAGVGGKRGVAGVVGYENMGMAGEVASSSADGGQKRPVSADTISSTLPMAAKLLEVFKGRRSTASMPIKLPKDFFAVEFNMDPRMVASASGGYFGGGFAGGIPPGGPGGPTMFAPMGGSATGSSLASPMSMSAVSSCASLSEAGARAAGDAASSVSSSAPFSPPNSSLLTFTRPTNPFVMGWSVSDWSGAGGPTLPAYLSNQRLFPLLGSCTLPPNTQALIDFDYHRPNLPENYRTPSPPKMKGMGKHGKLTKKQQQQLKQQQMAAQHAQQNQKPQPLFSGRCEEVIIFKDPVLLPRLDVLMGKPPDYPHKRRLQEASGGCDFELPKVQASTKTFKIKVSGVKHHPVQHLFATIKKILIGVDFEKAITDLEMMMDATADMPEPDEERQFRGPRPGVVLSVFSNQQQVVDPQGKPSATTVEGMSVISEIGSKLPLASLLVLAFCPPQVGGQITLDLEKGRSTRISIGRSNRE